MLALKLALNSKNCFTFCKKCTKERDLTTQGIQRVKEYTALNLGISALYYFGVKNRFIPGAILNKQVAAIALSVIAQASRGFLIPYDERNGSERLSQSLKVHVAAIAILGIGSYLCGVPAKTNAVVTLALGLAHAEIATFIFHRPLYTPPTFPRPADAPLDEAHQVLGQMKEGPLKDSAEVQIDLAQPLLPYCLIPLYTHVKQVMLLCGLAEQKVLEKVIIEECMRTVYCVSDPYLRAACALRVAYTARRLSPGQDNFEQQLFYCKDYQTSVSDKEKKEEVSRWIAAFNRNEKDFEHSKLDEPTEHHMTRCAYFLQEGNLDEARKETRKENRNLYWRVEALCTIAKAMAH